MVGFGSDMNVVMARCSVSCGGKFGFQVSLSMLAHVVEAAELFGTIGVITVERFLQEKDGK